MAEASGGALCQACCHVVLRGSTLQKLMQAGKDTGTDLTTWPLLRTMLWMACRSRCLKETSLFGQSPC